MHSLSGKNVTGHFIIVGAEEIVLADLSRLLGIKIGEGGRVGADVSLDSVGKHVHTCIGGDACGNALYHLNVENSLLGEKLLVDDGVLYVLLGIGDKVRIVETRKLSRTKNWRVSEIIEKAK